MVEDDITRLKALCIKKPEHTLTDDWHLPVVGRIYDVKICNNPLTVFNIEIESMSNRYTETFFTDNMVVIPFGYTNKDLFVLALQHGVIIEV